MKTIDAAFRRLSRRYHPDLNPGDARAQTAFERLEMAHSILTDSRKRSRYDSEDGSTAKDVQVLARTSTEVKNETRSYADLFRHLCDNARRARPERGRDVHTSVVCRLADSERGRRTTVEVRRLHRCLDCSGTGRLYDGDNPPCATCMGSGKEVFGRGPLAVAVACGDCSGEGLQAGAACGACHASGLTTRKRNTSPPDTCWDPRRTDNSNRGRWAPGPKRGTAWRPGGHCKRTKTIPRFQRNGPHLVTSVPITVSEAILGGRIEVPTIDGPNCLTSRSSGNPVAVTGCAFVGADLKWPTADVVT